VIAAKVFGFFFHYRAPATVAVREPVPHDTAGPSAGAQVNIDAEYTILAVLEFNSTRKRQSVVVRQPDGSILLQCKARAPCPAWMQRAGLWRLLSSHHSVYHLPCV